MTANSRQCQVATAIPYTIGDYWMAIYRRKWIILVIVICAAVCSGYVSVGITPQYESKTEFYVPADVACQSCGGSRIRPEAAAVRLGDAGAGGNGASLVDVTAMSLSEADPRVVSPSWSQ